MVHLPPGARLLTSYANNNLAWWKALAEFVDNSIDAGASRIVIDMTKRLLSVSDDGNGCEEITAMFKLGDHVKGARTKLGRYGIGAKDAWLSCSDQMTVETVRNKILTRMSVNYIDWMQNDWNANDPASTETEKPSGTRIELPLRNGKNKPSKDAFQDIAFAFTPAIKQGIQILESANGKRIPLAPHEMPSRESIVVSEFEIDGKKVSIDIGILPDGVKVKRGPFWLIHEHRIIDSTSLGAGQYGVRRIAGTVTIGDGWKLSKNKDDLTENQDRLGEAIFVRIEHILREADALAETIESAAFRNELQGMLNDAINNLSAEKDREKRPGGKGESIGSVEPKDTGRKRRKAKAIQFLPGSIDKDGGKAKRGGYSLDFCEIDKDSIGKFDCKGKRVSLNLNHHFVAAMKIKGNRDALISCASALIADYACRHNHDGEPVFKFSFQDFAKAMAAIVYVKEDKTNAQEAV